MFWRLGFDVVRKGTYQPNETAAIDTILPLNRLLIATVTVQTKTPVITNRSILSEQTMML